MRRLMLAWGLWAALSASLSASSFASAAAVSTPPQRIVSLNLCTDQILLQLVARERIAALSWLSPNPENSALYREAQGLRTVRGNAEEVIALKPDLVLVGTTSTRFTTRVLREFGIPVLALAGVDSLDQVREQIRTVAQAVGETATGEAVVARFDARRAELAKQVQASHPAGPMRIATQYLAGGRSAGIGTIYDDIFQVAGYANGAARAGLKRYGTLPMERVVVEHPDVLVTSDYRRGVPTLGNRMLAHPALRGLDARELVMPGRLTVCGGPWNLEAAALLARQGVHP